MSYTFTCGKCKKTSKIADDVQLGMCPQCGAVIHTNREDFEEKEELITLRPTPTDAFLKEYTDAQKEAFLDQCRQFLDEHSSGLRYNEPSKTI